MADILVYHPNGTFNSVTPSGTGDSDRGVALVAALNSATAGDTILVPPGVYLLASGQTATRADVRVHLRAGAEVKKEGFEPGAVISVTAGAHFLSGFGRIVNKGVGDPIGSTGSRTSLEVKGGTLICSVDYVESTWDKSSAVVVQGTVSDAVLRSRYSLAIDYDGIEVTGGGCTIAVLRSASTSNPSDDGNSIEETNGTGIKREIQVVRGDSLAGPSLNLVGNGRSAIKCQTATSASHSAAKCLYGSKTVSVGFTGTYGGLEPTVLAQNSFASFTSLSCYYGFDVVHCGQSRYCRRDLG